MAARTATERMLTPAPAGHRNGLPGREDYTYQGTGKSDPRLDRQWLADQLAARSRNKADTPSSALATSKEARAADAVPPPVIKLTATTDETGGQVFERPEPRALPAPEPEAAPAPKRAPRRCRGCGYLKARCACPPRGGA